VAATIIDWINRIFPFLVFVFGVDSLFNGIRLRRIIARDGGVELSGTFGLRHTSFMIGTGVLFVAYSTWRFISMLRH